MLKVMVVDNSTDLCALLERVIHGSGYDVDCITQTDATEYEINWDDYNLIFLDAGVSEFNTLENYKMSQSKANICLMSVFNEEMLTELQGTISYDWFLQKPYKLNTVRQILEISKTTIAEKKRPRHKVRLMTQ